MASDDPLAHTDRLLAALDFASLSSAQEEKHQRRMAALLRGCLEVTDSLQSLETHCRELVERGLVDAPHRSARLILRQMLRVLSEAGVEPMHAAGKPLDLDLHEVEAVRADSTAAEDTVLEETTAGYLWKGSVLRRAKVIVTGDSGSKATDLGVREDPDPSLVPE